MGDCPFCAIVAGQQPAHVIEQTDETIAFLDRRPAVTGHTIVAPTDHRLSLVGTRDGKAGVVFRAVDRIARGLTGVLDPEGFSVFHTTGGLVGRVDHAHVHLLPREADDSIHLSLRREPLVDADAARLAERVTTELETLDTDSGELHGR